MIVIKAAAGGSHDAREDTAILTDAPSIICFVPSFILDADALGLNRC